MWYLPLVERNILPDTLLRWGIRSLLAKRLAQEGRGGDDGVARRRAELDDALLSSPVAVETGAANEQHYEVPTAFFERVLGPAMKYSSCLWEEPVRDLPSAERAMLDLYLDRAEVRDGMSILDLGCGWGSFTLHAAAALPASMVTAVSNSRTQRQFIESAAKARGLRNVRVITADINRFDPGERFDRIVSVEMLEHVRNYDRLFGRLGTWVRPGGLMFVHVFCHRRFAYLFEPGDRDDWMARYFFTGGVMPSADLLPRHAAGFAVRRQWVVDGRHYERTCNAWLENMDRERTAILPLFREAYGADQALRWWAYWRIFFMACAELFGYRGGQEWFVSHYLFEPAAPAV
jgi:cyclopropane-fatty-acyl-phospholipid synthase